MRIEHFLTFFFLAFSTHCFTQNESIHSEEIKDLTTYLDSIGVMLSHSTGYLVEYDDAGDGYPIDLKYSSKERLDCLTKANDYYSKTILIYKNVKPSLTYEQIDEFQSIDKSLIKIIKDIDYEEYISSTDNSLPAKKIFPTITFIEIVKSKINKFSTSFKDNVKSINKEVNQEAFIRDKTELFKKQISSGVSVSEIRFEQSSLTQKLLRPYNYEIMDWEGEIIWIDMFKENELDIAISILKREIVGSKTISSNGQSTTYKCGITIEAGQIPYPKRGYKGIPRNGNLYNKIKRLKEGDKVVFSAKVVDSRDDTEETGLNLNTQLVLEIIDINKLH